MLNKSLKILLFLSIFILQQGCGYQTLLTENYQKFSVKSFNIDGNKKLGQALSNYFNEIDNAENNLIFNIKGEKQKEISNRSSAGTPLEYKITLDFNLKIISYPDNNEVFDQNFSQSGSFKASKLHIDSINQEKKIVDNIVKNIAGQVTNRLNLIYK